MDSQAFTLFHVALSLIGILSGLIVLYGLLTANRMAGMTAIFLITTAATSVTGFFFQRDHILPSHITGIVALIVMIPTLYALYAKHLGGFWRAVYVIGAVISLYLNVFVLVVQLFLKVPALHALAPNAPAVPDPPFATTQAVVLVAFIVLGFLAVRRFHPATR